MSDEPKPTASPDSPEEMSRRQFFVKIGVGSVAVAALGHRGLRIPVLVAERALRTVTDRRCRETRPLCS